MKETKTLDRREFTLASAMAVLSGVAITISGCGGGSSNSGGGGSPAAPSNPTPAPTPAPGSVNGAISANHGHTAVITAAQISAGNMLTLDITGDANHPHSVDLTMADVAAIGAGTQVAKVSSTNDGHMHNVTFN